MASSGRYLRRQGKPGRPPTTTVRHLPDEPPPPSKELILAARQGRPVAMQATLTEDNAAFVRKLAEVHNQPLGYVIDRLVEAARWGVPFRIESNLPQPLKQAILFLEAKKSLDDSARDRAARVAKNRGKPDSFRESDKGEPA